MSARRVVVVGAGGAGIPLASRLALAGVDVTLVEAGSCFATDAAREAALGPAWTVRAAMPGSRHAWTYPAELQDGRAWSIARGRILGGSTAVNGAYFQRPHPDDFARWAEVAGPEWSYSACLPALRRLERDLDFGADSVHGTAGPVPVQRADGNDVLTRGFLAASIAAGASAEADKNGGGESGVGLLPRNARGARRADSLRSYAALLSGVRICVDTDVVQVRSEHGRVSGVEVVADRGQKFLPADEVVLCAGAIETPRLLRASGIDAGGAVGAGLSDHAAVGIAWLPREGITLSEPVAGWTAAWNAPAGAVADRAVEYLFAVTPTAAIVMGDPDAGGPLDLRVTLTAPATRGRVSPRSDPVAVRYRHLSDAGDREALREAVRVGARLLRSSALADVVGWSSLDDVDVADDARLDAWVTAQLGTALHASSTARMGAADDPGAVVDPHGRVFGIEGLRVADTSILPVVPSRGTALVAVMLGERIA
ncbi:MAG: GMC family oxidoreductase N-terminal domain-containing protein, partial [Actinobacteria bacterium]|nr:GMC family oxidoreductase N-terminal domain-containing protein [Actinomycetota bacterium]